MSTPSSDTYIQVLYELALSIEPATEVEETLSQGIASYLQKLDCSGGAAFETQVGLEGGVTYDLVTKLPTRSSLVDEAVAEAPRRLPDTVAGLASECPVVDEVGTDVYRYYMRLPEFGVLVLTRRGSPLPDRVVQSLPRLNEKLATACGKVAVQRDYETQYRELFERAPVMFALTKRVGGEPVVADCNRRFASKLEYEVDDLVGRPLADLYTDESATVLEEDYERALAGEFGVEERVFRTRLGRRVTTLLRSTPRRDRDGTVVGTNSLYVDVTALKRRNQQLSVLNRILRHNLRNDLMAIHAQVETAIEHADDGTADRLADAAERAEGLLSTAEVSTRVRRIVGDTEVERRRLDDTLRRLADRAREAYPDATVAVSADPAAAMATRSVDAALWELFENACEHAGDAPHVDASVRCDGTETTVTIVDDGPGIPEHEHQVLTDSEETPLEHASGLGLWLVYWVAEASGGDIAFDADDGTTVTVTLQAVPDG